MDIIAISRREAAAVLDNGEVVPFANMFDGFGDETDDGSLATVAVVSLPNGTWMVLDLTDYEAVALH